MERIEETPPQQVLGSGTSYHTQLDTDKKTDIIIFIIINSKLALRTIYRWGGVEREKIIPNDPLSDYVDIETISLTISDQQNSNNF